MCIRSNALAREILHFLTWRVYILARLAQTRLLSLQPSCLVLGRRTLYNNIGVSRTRLHAKQTLTLSVLHWRWGRCFVLQYSEHFLLIRKDRTRHPPDRLWSTARRVYLKPSCVIMGAPLKKFISNPSIQDPSRRCRQHEQPLKKCEAFIRKKAKNLHHKPDPLLLFVNPKRF